VRRVLVTRPEPGASRTAKRLAVLGFEPVLLPLTKTAPLLLDDWPKPEELAAVAVTSANAVRHAPPELLQHIARLPVYAVGEKTSQAARDAGLQVAYTGAGDADHLARRIIGEFPSSTRILILCGRVRRGVLEEELGQAGFVPVVAETYDTIATKPSEQELKEALAGVPVDAALLYSGVAAEIFAEIVGRDAIAPLFEYSAYFAISSRVADKLPAATQVHVAGEPTEDAMLTLLAERI